MSVPLLLPLLLLFQRIFSRAPLCPSSRRSRPTKPAPKVNSLFSIIPSHAPSIVVHHLGYHYTQTFVTVPVFFSSSSSFAIMTLPLRESICIICRFNRWL